MASQEGSEAATENTSEAMPDADIRIGSFVLSGVRTYSIILLIVVTYCYLTLKLGTPASIDGMRELVLMAVGFLFGAKVMKR